ncbi:TIR domain-containing protein [Rhizobium pisi]|uniref:TIR domain-containing protein n=1 Tax=Rhizobium TaxID=379 RepID=UPI003CFC708C
MAGRRHVFISHHHADDEHVDRLSNMLARQGYEIRNSSIRAKPSNQARLDRGMVKDETIRRLLRRKMSWASTVIVLIGKETHARPWVNWEIQKANQLGKRIVGVFARGATDADIPPAFDKYGSALVNWNSNSVMDAIEGKDNPFESAGGGQRAPVFATTTSRC